MPEGAYNIRANGHLASRQTTANISIESKTDVSGIDIRIKPGTVNESVHIPVVLSESGLKEMVYNDFYIGEGSDVLIVAGCGSPCWICCGLRRASACRSAKRARFCPKWGFARGIM